MASIIDVEGIGPKYKHVLKEKAGISTTEALLKAAATPQQRKELAAQTGISPKLILEWANLADLFRVQGVGEEYSDLLEEAGVDTVVELAKRRPDKLYATLSEVNTRKRLVRRLPGLEQVKGWVAQAKRLPRVLHY